MADLKVSQLTAATTVGLADLLLLSQGGASIKIDIETILLNLPLRLVVKEASETVASGALATNKLVSKVTVSDAVPGYTLAAGTHGMEKVIACTTTSGSTPSSVVTVSSAAGFSSITFNAVGDTVHLRNIDGTWFVVSANSVVLA